MVGWHYPVNRHKFEQAPETGDGQGGLVCSSPWGHNESDVTEVTKVRLGLYEISRDSCNHTENYHEGAADSRRTGEHRGKAWNERPGRQQDKQEGSQAPTLSTTSTLYNQKRTLLLLQNHSVSSSRYNPLYLKYGKGQWFTNLAINSDHRESSVKYQC